MNGNDKGKLPSAPHLTLNFSIEHNPLVASGMGLTFGFLALVASGLVLFCVATFSPFACLIGGLILAVSARSPIRNFRAIRDQDAIEAALYDDARLICRIAYSPNFPKWTYHTMAGYRDSHEFPRERVEVRLDSCLDPLTASVAADELRDVILASVRARRFGGLRLQKALV